MTDVARAVSEDVISVITVVENSEIYQPDARAYQYRYRADLGDDWRHEDFHLSVQDVAYYRDPDSAQPHLALLSAEGDLYHFASPNRFQERIVGAGTTADDSKCHGKMLKMSQIGERRCCGLGCHRL
ncbi:hypothetical protein [Rhizobium sp. RCC_161_2]|uniref:hypothetical protein n=1 Tax=Rhizobium sp. RCC_161_2 TaxID=3239219 RepID=UPI003523C06D